METVETNVYASTSLAEAEEVMRLTLGEADAFSRIYERYHQSVYANILKMVKAPQYAEEILQDVFVSLWQNRANMRAGQSVGGWLFVVSYNQSMTFLKKKLRETISFVGDYPLDLADQTDVADEQLYEQQLALLDEAVSVLPKRKREVFRLYRYEGWSKEEVAHELGISTASVGDYLKQSNKAIRMYIAARYPYATGMATLLLYLFDSNLFQ